MVHARLRLSSTAALLACGVRTGRCGFWLRPSADPDPDQAGRVRSSAFHAFEILVVQLVFSVLRARRLARLADARIASRPILTHAAVARVVRRVINVAAVSARQLPLIGRVRILPVSRVLLVRHGDWSFLLHLCHINCLHSADAWPRPSSRGLSAWPPT